MMTTLLAMWRLLVRLLINPCQRLEATNDDDAFGDVAEAYRVEARKPWADAHTVLASEVFEYLEALKRGDLKAAEAEMGDVFAVMLRGIDFVKERMAKDE